MLENASSIQQTQQKGQKQQLIQQNQQALSSNKQLRQSQNQNKQKQQQFEIVQKFQKGQEKQQQQVQNIKNQIQTQIENSESMKLEQITSQENVQNIVTQQTYIGDYESAPQFMKDNKGITGGYRINFNSTKHILKSLFMLHNESINIWSHFLPALIIIFGIIIYIIASQKYALKEYKSEIQKNIEYYNKVYENFTMGEQIEEIQNNMAVQYHNIINKIIDNIHQYQIALNQQYNKIKHQVQDGVLKNSSEFAHLKRQLQKHYIPNFMNQVNSRMNYTYVNQFKQNLLHLKNIIDSIDTTFNPHHISIWPIFAFLLSAFVCLFCSSIFHLFYPMSHRHYLFFSRLDYAGVNILIAGSSIPALYYGLYCNFQVALFYMILSTLIATFVFIVCLFAWIHRPQNIAYKALIFSGFGLYNIFPLSHIIINEVYFDNYGDAFNFLPSLPYYLLLGVAYLLGVYIYAARCPQKKYPGKVNVCGHSHQIWHLFVVLGIAFTYFGCLQNFQSRKNNLCPLIEL